MLDPKTFNCERCGECCIKYIVKLSKADIKKIKRLGYNDKEFAELDEHLPEPDRFVLKKDEDYRCVFLRKDKEGAFNCKIYEHRPAVCIRYPFLRENVESCKPVGFSK